MTKEFFDGSHFWLQVNNFRSLFSTENAQWIDKILLYSPF